MRVRDQIRAKAAELTVSTTEVASEKRARDHATVEANRAGRVTAFAYKPSRPTTTTVGAEIFVYSPGVLVEVPEELHRERTAEAEPDDTGLGDYGERLASSTGGRTYTRALPGTGVTWASRTPTSPPTKDLLSDDAHLFADPAWPFLTRRPPRVPARFDPGCVVEDSLVSPGPRVAGVVRRSVLGPGVVVEAGAEIYDSVVGRDSTVEKDARVWWAARDARHGRTPRARHHQLSFARRESRLGGFSGGGSAGSAGFCAMLTRC